MEIENAKEQNINKALHYLKNVVHLNKESLIEL